MDSQVLEVSQVMTVEFGVTRQPESYQNVRCSVSLPVILQPGDDVPEKLAVALAMVMEQVYDQVDREYEQGYEMPAVYSNVPRFAVRVVKDERVAVIVPQTAPLPDEWERYSNQRLGGHRLSFISQVVDSKYPGYTVIDCTDGDWSKLPPLEMFNVWRYTPRSGDDSTPAMVVLTLQQDDLPNRIAYSGWWQGNNEFRMYANFLAELKARAKKEGVKFFDCTDGDFSCLPQPPKPEVKPEAEEETGPEEDDIIFGDGDEE